MDESAGLDDPTIAPSTDASVPKNQSGSVVAKTLPSIGTQVGPYEILSEIARGAMGVVYRAKHATLDRIVAIKMVLEGDGAEDDLRQRFANEARAAASLDHPGIVPVFEFGQWNECPYFAMAFIEGPSLATVLRDGPLTTQRASQIAREVADGIGHAHKNQIIHRDLKPANILIDQTGAARVTDFGVSKLLDSTSDLTQCGELIGTPHFMPPEQAGGSKQPIGPAADVYSIGAVLFAMLTGRPPFQAASPVDVIAQVVTQQPVPPSALNSRVPSELEVITLKCLSKRVEDRYSSADELSDDLSRFMNGDPILAKPPGWIQRGRLFMRRHVLLASVSGTAAMLLVFTTIAVLVSLLHARSNISELTDKLANAEQQIQVERRMVSKFIGTTNSSNSSDSFGAYEVSRLAASADHQSELNPDLALQLAIAAVERSVHEELPLPGPMLELLRDRLRANLLADEKEPPFELPTDTKELIELARQQIAEPLTEAERLLYGITNDEDLNNSSATREED